MNYPEPIFQHKTSHVRYDDRSNLPQGIVVFTILNVADWETSSCVGLTPPALPYGDEVGGFAEFYAGTVQCSVRGSITGDATSPRPLTLRLEAVPQTPARGRGQQTGAMLKR